MINIGLSPNLTPGDSWLALKMLFQPRRWKKGKAVGKLEDWFRKYLGLSEVVSFNSGRSAEYAILKALNIKEGDEVLLQAFTCVAVPNSVLWMGATPVYVDIDESLTMDSFDLERKITQKSKAIIVQHTFGQLAKLDKICRIAKEHNLYVIEDCAHIIKKDIKGDAAFFSFGRDKVISSVFGGMGVTSKKLKVKSSKLKEIQQKLTYPSLFWIFQQLLHPVVSAIILPLYNWANLGKLVLFGLQKLKLLSLPVYSEEKKGLRPNDFPTKMPNALAELASAQLGKLEEFEEKRKEITKIYEKELEELEGKGMLKRVQHDPSASLGQVIPLLRYPILVEKPDELRKFTKKRGIILGNWYTNVIDPKGVNFEKIGYQSESCPIAEKIAKQIVNLPTYPRMEKDDVFRVIRVIREFFP